MWQYLVQYTSSQERPPHWLLVRVGTPALGAGTAEGETGGTAGSFDPEALRSQLQHLLDGFRRTDIAAAREALDAGVRSSCRSWIGSPGRRGEVLVPQPGWVAWALPAALPG